MISGGGAAEAIALPARGRSRGLSPEVDRFRDLSALRGLRLPPASRSPAVLVLLAPAPDPMDTFLGNMGCCCPSMGGIADGLCSDGPSSVALGRTIGIGKPRDMISRTRGTSLYSTALYMIRQAKVGLRM